MTSTATAKPAPAPAPAIRPAAVRALQRAWRLRRVRRLRSAGTVCPITQDALRHPLVALRRPGHPASRTFLDAGAFYAYVKASGKAEDPLTRRPLTRTEAAGIDAHMAWWRLEAVEKGDSLVACCSWSAGGAAVAPAPAGHARDIFLDALRVHTDEFIAGEMGLGTYVLVARGCLAHAMRVDDVGAAASRAAAAETLTRITDLARAAYDERDAPALAIFNVAASALRVDDPLFVRTLVGLTVYPSIASIAAQWRRVTPQ